MAEIETRSYDQLPEATTLSPDDIITMQSPGGGPAKKIKVGQAFALFQNCDIALQTVADLTTDAAAIALPVQSLAVVYANPDATQSGYWIKTSSAGSGTWALTDIQYGYAAGFAEQAKAEAERASAAVESVVAQSTAIKDPCEVATTEDIALAGEKVIDGVQTAASRVLVKNQTSAAENGIYVSDVGAWSRAADFDSIAEVVTGALVNVSSGSQAGAWVLVTAGVINVGATPQTWRLLRAASAKAIATQDGANVEAFTEETVRVIKYVPFWKRAALWANTYLQTNAEFDLTAAWIAARAYGDSLGVGVTYELPRGKLKMDIDASDDTGVSFSKYMVIKGQGRGSTIITATGSGKPIINLAGRNRSVLRDFTIEANAYQAPCAIFMARLNTSQQCNNNKVLNLEIEGNFSAHAVVSCAAESSLWSNVRIAPQNSTGFASGFWTGVDPAKCGVVTPNGKTAVVGPNTDNRMANCEIYSTGSEGEPKDGVTNITLSESAGWVFDNVAHINGQATNSVAYRFQGDADGVFNGPVFFNGNHFEAFGTNNKGLYVDGNGIITLYNVHLNGGNAVVDNGYRVVDFNRNQNLSAAGSLFIASSLIMPSIPAPVGSGLPAYVWALSNTRVWWRDRFAAGDFVVFAFAARCHIDAAFPAIGSNAQSTIVQWEDVTPTAGTFCRGQVINYSWSGVAVADGQPTQAICEKLGTLGTLNDGATSASVVNNSRDINFSSATGLKVGQVLSIGGNTYRLAMLSGAAGKLSVPYIGATAPAVPVAFEGTSFKQSGVIGMTTAAAVAPLTGSEDLPTVMAKINEIVTGQKTAKQMRTV